MILRFDARALELFRAGPTGGLQVVAATDSAPAELLIYDVIGEDWNGNGVTAKGVIAALAQAGDGPITVRINSPGGEVFDGMAIYNTLRAHPGGVSVVVDGLAASAASLIAMAGASVTMHATSTLMIHNARTLAWGDAGALRQTADVVEKISSQFAAAYAEKTGMTVDAVRTMLDAETWMTPTEAKACGFCDAIVAPPAKKAKAVATAETTDMAAAEPTTQDNSLLPQMLARLRLAELT